MYQVIEGLKKVVEYWGDDYLVGRRDFYKEIIDITPITSQGLALLSSCKCLESFTCKMDIMRVLPNVPVSRVKAGVHYGCFNYINL